MESYILLHGMTKTMFSSNDEPVADIGGVGQVPSVSRRSANQTKRGDVGGCISGIVRMRCAMVGSTSPGCRVGVKVKAMDYVLPTLEGCSLRFTPRA